jgi:hypothetical protein
MTYDAVHSGELDVGRVLQRTFGVVGRNVPTLFVLGILFVGAPNVLAQLALGSSSTFGRLAGQTPAINWQMLLGSYVLLFAGTGLYNMAAVRVAVDDAGGKRASIIDGLVTVFQFLLPGLAAGALVLIGGVFTYLLLIIPGVIFLLTFVAVLPAIVAERASVFGAFRRSAELTRGRRGAIFGAVFLIGIIAGIGNLVLGGVVGLIVGATSRSPIVLATAIGLLTGVTTSVFATFYAVLYLRLVELKGGGAKQKLDQVFA